MVAALLQRRSSAMPASAAEPLQLNAYWGPRRCTALEVAERIVAFVRALEELHPAFAGLAIARVPRGRPPLALGVRDDVANVLAALESAEHVYTNPDPADTRFGAESVIATGFSLPLAPADTDVAHDAAITLQITAGGFDEHGAANQVMVALPSRAPTGLLERDTLAGLMRVVVETWSPERAWLLGKPWRRAARVDDCDIVIGWMTYLAAGPTTSTMRALARDLRVQPLAQGTLLTLGDAAPDAGDAALVATAQAVARTLAR
jgi:hypothetical protein